MNPSRQGCIEAWVPRGLVSAVAGRPELGATAEGLLPLSVHWNQGKITRLEPIGLQRPEPRQLLLPRLVEPHAHLDKAFSWREAHNLAGTYDGALAANLAEHRSRDRNLVLKRAGRALQHGLGHGLRAVRSHVDSLGPAADGSWEALLELQRQWRGRMELQLVALRPLDQWTSSSGRQLAARVARSGGLLGIVLGPPCHGSDTCRALGQILGLADQLGCGIDLHIDEASTDPGAGLRQLIRVLQQNRIEVPITCSHVSSMSLLPATRLRRLAEQLACHQVGVVALPLTNAWLLGRQIGATPVQRPIAPIRQLQRAGVTVAVGADNVQDPWFPAGNFDPLALMAMALPLAQLAPWQRLGLAPFTTAAAQLLGLAWNGTLFPGAPADLILLDASSWAEALASPPRRRVLVEGGWLEPACRDDLPQTQTMPIADVGSGR